MIHIGLFKGNSIYLIFHLCFACLAFTTGCTKYIPNPIIPPGPPVQVSFEAHRSWKEYRIELHKSDGEKLDCTTPCSIETLSGSVSIGVFRRERIKYLMQNVILYPGQTTIEVNDGKLGVATTAVIFGLVGAGLVVAAAIYPSYDVTNLLFAGIGVGFGLFSIPFAVTAGRNRLTVRSGNKEKIYTRNMNIPF